jgi:hypothetical protein
MEQKLRVTQRRMERSNLGITFRDRKRNQWLRSKTDVQDIVDYAKRSKRRCVGHVARRNDGRWIKLVTEWRPVNGKRRGGRPVRRWRDETVMTAGKNWMKRTQQSIEWNTLGETFVKQWTENG